EQIKCCGSQANDSDERIQRALTWLASNFSVEQNPQKRRAVPWHYYYLWGLEHACRLTGQRAVGDHKWYREGASMLCRAQDVTGSWQDTVGIESDPNIAIALALLFLGEGRRPVVVSKLEHGPGADWNHHRH